MTLSYEDSDRQVIPRWRSYKNTGAANELTPFSDRNAPPAAIDDSELHHRIGEWHEHGTISFAADVLSTALVVQNYGAAASVANYIHDHAAESLTSLHSLAKFALTHTEGVGESVHAPTKKVTEDFRKNIHIARANLRKYPPNPLLWVDLALFFEIVGQYRKARSALRAAIALAPNSTFVLRSAARLYVHQDDLDTSHDLLLRANKTLHDPWLLSAEIAVATAAKRTSKNLKRARKYLDSDKFPPFHSAELASAVATLEAHAGNAKRSRRLVLASLRDPTENAVAQAAWLHRHHQTIPADPIIYEQKNSYEASAWHHNSQQEWSLALNQTEQWLCDEPFSSRPAILGSYIAAVCVADFDGAVQFAKRGLAANPKDFLLLNNLTFSLAMNDAMDEAGRTFARIDKRSLTPPQHGVWNATNGLLSYRRGQPDVGRDYYRKAIRTFDENRASTAAALAYYFFALEELRIGSPLGLRLRAEALDHLKREDRPDLRSLMETLDRT